MIGSSVRFKSFNHNRWSFSLVSMEVGKTLACKCSTVREILTYKALGSKASLWELSWADPCVTVNRIVNL